MDYVSLLSVHSNVFSKKWPFEAYPEKVEAISKKLSEKDRKILSNFVKTTQELKIWSEAPNIMISSTSFYIGSGCVGLIELELEGSVDGIQEHTGEPGRARDRLWATGQLLKDPSPSSFKIRVLDYIERSLKKFVTLWRASKKQKKALLEKLVKMKLGAEEMMNKKAALKRLKKQGF